MAVLEIEEVEKKKLKEIEIEEVAGKEIWLWLRDRSIKREIELLIMAAQEQAIRTNTVKAKIDKTQARNKCILCGKVDETVRHILCECSMLAQRKYKRRHDWVGRKHVEKLVFM